jgi:glycosyltransferase involved in cell wall biosynthesis
MEQRSRDRTTNVLFMQSQEDFGSVTLVHSQIMAHLNRERFAVHVACTAGRRHEPSQALLNLSAIPDLSVRPTNFGPSLNSHTPAEAAIDGVRTAIPGLYGLAGLARYIRRNRIRIIHCTEKPRDAVYGLLLSRLTGAKVVVHLHIKLEDWLSPLSQRALRRADGLIGVSEFVAESARSFGYSPNRIFWALNALDASRWNPGTDGSKVRSELGVPVGTPLVALIAKVLPWKGHALLLKALGELRAAGRDFRVLIAGDVVPRITPGGSRHLEELHSLVQSLGLSDLVHFLGFRSDVMELLAACDVFALPSFEEPCAVAYLEAMAMAKPVVALRSGGTPELVVHGQTGLLSEPKDVAGLARNLAILCENPELRANLGGAGRRRVEDVFTPSRLAADIELIYRHLLTPRG